MGLIFIDFILTQVFGSKYEHIQLIVNLHFVENLLYFFPEKNLQRDLLVEGGNLRTP